MKYGNVFTQRMMFSLIKVDDLRAKERSERKKEPQIPRLGDKNSSLIFIDFFLLQEQSLKNNKLPPPQQVRRSKSRETLISNGDGDNTSEANFMARPATVISNTSGSSTASGNSNNL